MGSYKDDLHIHVDESGPRFTLACELLSSGRGVVVLDNTLALRPEPNRILCEVIAESATPASFPVAVQAAQSLLERSTIPNILAGKALSWLVVDDYGMGVHVLWHGS